MEDKTPLSEREREILRLLATGASNKEIAAQLVISANTVKTHLRNIFSKIGVVSRTEATLYAIREKIVDVPSSTPEGIASESNTVGRSMALPITARVIPVQHSVSRYVGFLALIIILTVGIGSGILLITTQSQLGPASASPAAPLSVSRWQLRAPMSTARSGLAATVFEDQIYAIGGETAEGITNAVEKFDPAKNSWTTLSPKPTSVSDVSSVVIAGKIYVPGGRMSADHKQISDLLEVYDPRRDSWQAHTKLPTPVSAYALAAVEGKIYLFGGWNGERYVDSAYKYDPAEDKWSALTPMPTAKGFASSAVMGSRILVIGGFNGQEALTSNDVYVPELDDGEGSPWSEFAPLPTGRYAMGAASTSNMIYVIGGENERATELPPLEYSQQQGQWNALQVPFTRTWSHLVTVPLGRHLYSVGGRINDTLTNQTMAYQAIYTILIPMAH